MHTFWHNLRYIFQSRYFSILLTPLGHNFSTRCNWTKAILAFKFCKVFWFRFCNFSSAASLQLQLILCFGLSAFPIIDLIPLWPFPFSLPDLEFWIHCSSAFIWFCTLRIRGSIPAQRAGLPASSPHPCVCASLRLEQRLIWIQYMLDEMPPKQTAKWINFRPRHPQPWNNRTRLQQLPGPCLIRAGWNCCCC